MWRTLYRGSPPPMRGKVRQYIRLIHLYRITPAYAGKRIPTTTARVLRRDHPRLCGEKANHRAFRLRFAGSPPPMRGKVLQCGICGRKVGITPAYAGKSSACHKHRHCDRDHPRLCGEKVVGFEYRLSAVGSPPPMRGKATILKMCAVLNGITPAYAGKS